MHLLSKTASDSLKTRKTVYSFDSNKSKAVDSKEWYLEFVAYSESLCMSSLRRRHITNKTTSYIEYRK